MFDLATGRERLNHAVKDDRMRSVVFVGDRVFVLGREGKTADLWEAIPGK